MTGLELFVFLGPAADASCQTVGIVGEDVTRQARIVLAVWCIGLNKL